MILTRLVIEIPYMDKEDKLCSIQLEGKLLPEENIRNAFKELELKAYQAIGLIADDSVKPTIDSINTQGRDLPTKKEIITDQVIPDDDLPF